MSLKLIKTAVTAEGRVTVATYRLEHNQPGRNGTCLSLDVTLEHGFNRIKVGMPDLAPEVSGVDPEAALDKLAEWLERSAIAIRKRGTPSPIFNLYTPE
jgi:hypothetical protein